MIKEILDSIVSRLNAADVENVYSAFDALPADKKGDIFTIVGIGAFETCAPVYSHYSIYLPFRTEIDLNLTARRDTSMEALFNVYCESVEPVLMSMTDMKCSLKKMSIRFDSNIQRLVLNVKLSASGMSRIERSIE